MKKIPLLTSQLLTILVIFIAATSVWSGSKTASVRYAKGFCIDYIEDATLVTVSNPWPGAQIAFKYLLKPRGSHTPAGYDDYQVVEVPVERTIALSTTFLAFLEQLELLDTLVGFSDLSRVHSRIVSSTAKKNGVLEVGQGPNLQVETILDLAPDIIFSFATGSFRDVHPKLIEAGLTVSVVGEYMEPHPLGRSEWIKFFALFFNKTKEAERIFEELEKRYQTLAVTTAALQQRPTVILGVPFSGQWYVAGGNSFVGKLLNDAGANYVWKETSHSGAIPMDIELVYERGLDADFWLNTGTWTALSQARETDPRFLEFRALTNGKLFNNNKRIISNGANDFWESGIMAPDVILADLISIINPQLITGHKRTYYTHLK